ncbi:serine/threonine-protein kinase [Sphingomonas mucosissima]|uniref:Serine/threonine-protein kinase PknA n=1 Tax=Sphingomonas mucosissima TaxID=370959 RepID=A0A245ZML2_9SPHN|nr:serine/threonine-protein kinase [Sphingomonas mucosissima]OWK30979.1 serine/threonine-protein kinase PknA [Sphingomonas mucosissima]
MNTGADNRDANGEEDDRTVYHPRLPDESEGERTVFNSPRAPGAPPPGSGGIKAGDTLNHMFSVRRFIARGGMGEVFEGTSLATDERVAIKVMLPALAADPNVIALFRREAQTLTRLHHEAVVHYRGAATDPELGVFYIVTEYIDGTALSDRLGTLRPDPAALTGLLRRLASGLAAAHRLGAIHRDVSPDNVLLAGDDLTRAKLIDFGIAKDLDPGSKTIVGDGFAGKLGYVAPEQLGDYDRSLGPWTDVYSLGLVILAVARGADLGLGGTLVDAVDKRRAGFDLSALPAALRPIVARMVKVDPADRFRDMEAVLAALRDVDALSPQPLPVRWIAVGAVVAVLLVVVALFALRPGEQPATNAAPASDTMQRARSAIDAALPSVGCTWLSITNIAERAGGIDVALAGVAGNPAQAQGEIAAALRGAGSDARAIDFADVSLITPAGCAALDAFRQIRATGASRLSVPQRRFAMRPQPADSAYAGRVAANAIVGIAIADPSLDFALLGLEPSGRIDMVIPSRAAFLDQVRASRNGVPITDLGRDRYRLQIDLDHAGWSGLLLVTGKGPFDTAALAPDLGARGSEWRNRIATLAGERGWRTDMVWFESVQAGRAN